MKFNQTYGTPGTLRLGRIMGGKIMALPHSYHIHDSALHDFANNGAMITPGDSFQEVIK